MNKEQAVTYLKFSGFSDEQIKAIEGAFSCPSAGVDCEDCPTYEKKTGHWIPSHVQGSILDECSECGFSCGAFTFKFCPMCGAKMQEVKDNG